MFVRKVEIMADKKLAEVNVRRSQGYRKLWQSGHEIHYKRLQKGAKPQGHKAAQKAVARAPERKRSRREVS